MVDLSKLKVGDEVLARVKIAARNMLCEDRDVVLIRDTHGNMSWLNQSQLVDHFPAPVTIEAGMTICGKPGCQWATGRALNVLCVADAQAWVQNPDTGERFTVFTEHYEAVL